VSPIPTDGRKFTRVIGTTGQAVEHIDGGVVNE